jgi:hypothetical protein
LRADTVSLQNPSYLRAEPVPVRMRPSRTPAATGAGPVTLSTGQTVELPLTTRATMVGAVFPAPWESVASLLPAGLRPLRVTPETAAVTLLSVDYHHVGVEGIDPYDEFAVVVPAVRGAAASLPVGSALSRATSGFVWYLPVTTEPARALGVDVWGYPKAVADVTHEDDGARRHTTVALDGTHLVTLSVERPPTVPLSRDGYNYTIADGSLCRVPTDVSGRVGAWPFTRRASVSFGDHPRVAPLAALDLGGRALARLAVDGTARFHPGDPVADG